MAIVTEQLQLLGYVTLAMLLGGVIGLDRERAGKPAGLRTHMLVAGGAAFLAGLGDILVSHFEVSQSLVQADPIRIIEAIITGISFLGAGTIIRQEDQIEGLTTAASLFFAAALGIGTAQGQFVLAFGAVVLGVLVLRGVKYLEKRIN